MLKYGKEGMEPGLETKSIVPIGLNETGDECGKVKRGEGA